MMMMAALMMMMMMMATMREYSFPIYWVIQLSLFDNN
jgi:hypothetical protein